MMFEFGYCFNPRNYIEFNKLRKKKKLDIFPIVGGHPNVESISWALFNNSTPSSDKILVNKIYRFEV